MTKVSSTMICACSLMSAFHWALLRQWLLLKSPAAMLSFHRMLELFGGGSCASGPSARAPAQGSSGGATVRGSKWRSILLLLWLPGTMRNHQQTEHHHMDALARRLELRTALRGKI